MSTQPAEAPAVRDRADVLVDLLGQDMPAGEADMVKLAIRLRRIANHLQRELRRELAAQGIEVWELEMVLPLHRAPGYQLSAGALLRGSQVTAGAITNRIARLEAQGLARRDVDPDDRRHILVTLTPDGVRRAECIAAVRTTTEQRLLGQADPDAIARMSADLRSLLLAVEGPATDEHAYEACTEQ